MSKKLSKLFDIIEDVTEVVDFVQDTADKVTDAVDAGKDILDAVKQPAKELVDTVKEDVVDPMLDHLTEHAVSMGATPTEDMQERLDKANPTAVDESFFTVEELKCPCGCEWLVMDDAFLARLNQARKIAGFPWHPSSAYRCPEHNKAVGGVAGSSHLAGKAIDIKAVDGNTKYLVVKAAMEAGFTRIGVAETFIHLDTDETKPQNTIWLY